MPTFAFPLFIPCCLRIGSRERVSYEIGRSSSRRRLLLDCFCSLTSLPPTLTLTLSLTWSPSTFMTLKVRHDLPQTQLAQKARDTAGKSNTDIKMAPDFNPQVLFCLECIRSLAETDLDNHGKMDICWIGPGVSSSLCYFPALSTSTRTDIHIVSQIPKTALGARPSAPPV